MGASARPGYGGSSPLLAIASGLMAGDDLRAARQRDAQQRMLDEGLEALRLTTTPGVSLAAPDTPVAPGMLDVARITLQGQPRAIRYTPAETPAGMRLAEQKATRVRRQAAYHALQEVAPNRYGNGFNPDHDYEADLAKEQDVQATKAALVRGGQYTDDEADLIARRNINLRTERTKAAADAALTQEREAAARRPPASTTESASLRRQVMMERLRGAARLGALTLGKNATPEAVTAAVQREHPDADPADIAAAAADAIQFVRGGAPGMRNSGNAFLDALGLSESAGGGGGRGGGAPGAAAARETITREQRDALRARGWSDADIDARYRVP